jgi:hypothetical protein
LPEKGGALEIPGRIWSGPPEARPVNVTAKETWMNPTRWIVVAALAVAALPAAAQAPAAKPDAAPAPQAAPAAEAAYVPAGEIRLRLSASYDATRVRGPNTNLSLASDGRWAGSIAGRPVRLEVTPTRISGAGVTLTVTREPERLTVQGTSNGARVRVIATATTVDVQLGSRQGAATRQADGTWRPSSPTGATANIRFTGSAADPLTAPMPQWILAVIGAM